MKEAIAASGETPLEYMLRIMRDEAAKSTRRDDAPKTLWPRTKPCPEKVFQAKPAATPRPTIRSDRHQRIDISEK